MKSNQLPEQILKNFYLMVVALLCVTAMNAPVSAEQSEAQQSFFERISGLCDTRFSGQSSFPEDPGDAWRHKQLVAHIETCGANEIRIPFSVGEDRSRTWILSRVEGGLQLKHDHRHIDGTPDKVTMYGGVTRNQGSPLAQSFPADGYTAELIPDAATNEWFLSLSEDGTELSYYLERHGQPRFRAVLKSTERIIMEE